MHRRNFIRTLAAAPFAINRIFESEGAGLVRKNYHRFGELLVGDMDLGTGFRPCIDAMFFGREARARIYLPQSINDPRPTRSNIEPTMTGSRLEWRDTVNNIGLNVYDFVQREPGEYDRGASEIEIVLGVAPPDDTLRMPFSLDGLQPYFQPALTATDVADGSMRPAHIVDSWALYHDSRRVFHRSDIADRYQTGKAGHIERAYAIDALGARTWLTTHIVDTEIRFVAPAGWFASTTGPWMIGPTVGYTTRGASTNTFGIDSIRGGLGTMSEDGTLNSIFCYARENGAANLKGVLLLQSDKSIPTNGVGGAVSAGGGPTPPTTPWQSDFGTSPSLSNGVSYYMSAINDVGMNNPGSYYDSGSTNDAWYDTTNSYTTPVEASSGFQQAFLLSTYGDYTAAGGGGPSPAVIYHNRSQQ